MRGVGTTVLKNWLEKVRCMKGWIIIFLCIWTAGSMELLTDASILNNPYVTFSPDGNAFTTNADETDCEWYENGYTISTGVPSELRDPKEGEHFYTLIRKDWVPIGKWTVVHPRGSCIHDRYTQDAYFHGVSFGKDKCFNHYYSGWKAFCADCGQCVVNNLFYMSDEAADSIKELDMSMAYYYRCPWCTNLEMGVELEQHNCLGISANQYSVRYHANFGKGYMPKSVHMYNNCAVYEGNSVTPQKNLTLNGYTRVGYEFVGWNTKQDGSGTFFGDGQEIYNLCKEEQGSVVLYAQWKKSQSVLCIDPGAGTYAGKSEVSRIPGLYGTNYEMAAEEVEAPAGAEVSFEVAGGVPISPIIGEQEFSEWSFRQPMHGKVQENVYTYLGKDGAEDYATAIYKRQGVILPEAVREGYSFGGWYYNPECTLAAGGAGDVIIPAKNMILYAQWVELQLFSEDNYIANEGKGAVDLTWRQSDHQEKTYLICQKRETDEWREVHMAEESSQEKQVSKQCEYSGEAGYYVIPYNGYYQLTLYGAQGENYGTYTGGKGGKITAAIYFQAGEKLLYEIGGQNGYHDGGSGKVYGNGGGSTRVSTADKGILLIAGGGGGASNGNCGQAGGSAAGVVENSAGQDGIAGGGGGYRGGAAGEEIVHRHTEKCRHVHIGSPELYGGCYTVLQTCGNNEFRKEKYDEVFYYGNIDVNGNHVYCVRCGSHQCPGHRDEYYQYVCTICNTAYKNYKPASCDANKRYGLSCGSTEQYVCGYEENQVIKTNSAYGGSNYVNEEVCLSYTEEQGVREGNGALIIEAIHIGFVERNYLNGVEATDYAAPDPIDEKTVEIKAVDADKINVSFTKPLDNGTTYYHMAESYDQKTGQKISTSNQTVNTLVSGIYGYRYRLDGEADTVPDLQDRIYVCKETKPYISVTVTKEKKYLHIAAQDKAGNLSDAIHVPISSQEIIFWPVVTEPMTIKNGTNVYKKQDGEVYGENVYYVKADGTTPFTVSFEGRLIGTAGNNYQINQLNYLAQNMYSVEDIAGGEEGTFKLIVPMSEVAAGSYSYKEEEIQRQYDDAFCIEEASFTEIRRSDFCRQLVTVQSFKLPSDLDGAMLRLAPQAAVITEDVQQMSDREQDLKNSLYLMADGQGPVIGGLELPKELPSKEGLVGTDGKWEFELDVTASDIGSGLKELWLEIRNADNGGIERLQDEDGDGCLSLTVSSENALFWGRFTITAYARDNVGNVSSESYGMDGLSVTACIENTRMPQSNTFKKGESGILHIQATGYAQVVEVIFPEVWSKKNESLNRVFRYEMPDSLVTEEVEFMVPLQIPEGEHQIVVRAYKEDQMAEARPEMLLIEVKGSILDEIRTRLR